MKRALLAAVALLAFAVGGCGRQRRARECNTFIDKVNGALKEINRYTDTNGVDNAAIVRNMTELSRRYRQLAGDIDEMHIQTPDLKRGTDEYRSMARAAAAAASHMAEAFQNKDVAESKSAEGEFQAVVNREHALIARINATCSKQ
jgi:hypothetical protein